jgi:transcriptional regulator with GAF, ATPase, and Fis domain
MTLVETWQTEGQEDSDVDLTSRARAIAHLRVLTGRVSQAVHVFQAGGTSVGRLGGDCDFVIDDGRMSRRHARIERGVTGWRLQDLVSRNGGFVDGRGFSAGERMALNDGSVIRLGDTLMVFRTSAPTSDGRADSPVFPGISPVVVAVRRRIDVLASGTGHALILGETGTGKERVAKAIGERRAPHPFVTLNSAELSRDLARSELFGHVRGAFTHATSNKPGLVDLAGDGVLFLDEIGELSLDVQAELLRFLEDGSYRPLGSTELRHSNARVVAATHVDLDQAVQNNRFRRDLLARLRASNVPLELPPLRERREDILGWTQLFLRQGNHDAGPDPWTVGALECLLLYPWAENLRGLGSIVVEAATLSQSFPCGTEHLSAAVRNHRGTLRARPNSVHDEPTPAQLPVQLPAQPEPTQSEIEAALRNTQGRVRTAAQQLGIDRRKLYRLCERFGIALESFRSESQREDE